MENIEVLNFGDFYILVSKINGNVLSLSIKEFCNRDFLTDRVEEFHMYKKIEPIGKYNKNLFKTIYISLHTSAKCNLSCTYCFKKERDNKNLSLKRELKEV